MKNKVLLIALVSLCAFGLSAVEGVINATSLNARLRPELASPVAMKLAKDAVVNVLAAKGNFYEIAIPENAPVYVSAAYIGKDGKLFKDQQLRVKASASAASYGVITAGTAVETVSVDRYGWARIKPPKALKLYVASFYVALKGKLEETAAVEKKAAAKTAKEVKKDAEPAKAALPALDPELAKLGIDAAKGEKVSVRGNLTSLKEKTIECVQYALTTDGAGGIEVICFISVPAGKDLSKFENQLLTVDGIAYAVPEWKKRVLRLEDFKVVK